jgi:hypothetical protein
MRFKLDENFGSRSARLFPEAGHDVETVAFHHTKPAESPFYACRKARH